MGHQDGHWQLVSEKPICENLSSLRYQKPVDLVPGLGICDLYTSLECLKRGKKVCRIREKDRLREECVMEGSEHVRRVRAMWRECLFTGPPPP